MSKLLDEFQRGTGKAHYKSIIDLLGTAGRDARTHRISVVMAFILRYYLEKSVNDGKEGSIAKALMILEEDPFNDGKEVKLIKDLIEQICRKAGLRNDRVAASGAQYSIAENTIEEFTRWYNMPWENW